MYFGVYFRGSFNVREVYLAEKLAFFLCLSVLQENLSYMFATSGLLPVVN